MTFQLGVLFTVSILAFAGAAAAEQAGAVFPGKEGAGRGKHVVFVTGDDEYLSEEGMPLLARILAERHGFDCTVLFAVNPKSGEIDVKTKDNIPGLEALDTADLMVLFTRFRQLPDGQMKHIVDYLDSGRPVMGLRTATHAFAYPAGAGPYAKYSWNYHGPDFDGGFGRQVLGETWINHWGHHGSQSTRGIIAPGAADNPILRGIKDGEIWGKTDVYEVKLPMMDNCKPLILGQVLSGMEPTDPPAPPAENPKARKTVDKNNPIMPVAWARTYTGAGGKPSRIFTTTMGGSMAGKPDWDNAALRRLLVNAAYWCVGLEDKIPEKANVDFVGSEESPYKRGVKPQDVR